MSQQCSHFFSLQSIFTGTRRNNQCDLQNNCIHNSIYLDPIKHSILFTHSIASPRYRHFRHCLFQWSCRFRIPPGNTFSYPSTAMVFTSTTMRSRRQRTCFSSLDASANARQQCWQRHPSARSIRKALTSSRRRLEN